MEDKYISVEELNNIIKRKLDRDYELQNIFLRGEVSNLTKHGNGHYYFTLKDEKARIAAVMFKSSVIKLDFNVESGMKVLASGRITAYAPSGQYQIVVEEMHPDGLGKLYLEYEKLKKKLAAEGLFDPLHKKPIPSMPELVGIITAPKGAAIRDILSTFKRRWPLTKTILFPALVQGEGSEESLIASFKKAQEYPLDLIIIGRGGGSIEDLWSFNSEALAREIYNSRVPVISGVGHEIDTTICDLVADKRAPTPTGAAEMAVKDQNNFFSYLNSYYARLKQAIFKRIELKKEKLNNLSNSFVLKNPKNIYEGHIQKLDHLEMKINNLFVSIVNDKKSHYELLKSSYKHVLTTYINKKNQKFDLIINKLDALSPLNTMKRGYSIIYKDEKIIKSAKKLKKDDVLELKLSDGDKKAKVL